MQSLHIPHKVKLGLGMEEPTVGVGHPEGREVHAVAMMAVMMRLLLCGSNGGGCGCGGCGSEGLLKGLYVHVCHDEQASLA